MGGYLLRRSSASTSNSEKRTAEDGAGAWLAAAGCGDRDPTEAGLLGEPGGGSTTRSTADAAEAAGEPAWLPTLPVVPAAVVLLSCSPRHAAMDAGASCVPPKLAKPRGSASPSWLAGAAAAKSARAVGGLPRLLLPAVAAGGEAGMLLPAMPPWGKMRAAQAGAPSCGARLPFPSFSLPSLHVRQCSRVSSQACCSCAETPVRLRAEALTGQ